MTIAVSVVVVSRDRPESLYRCVLGLSQVQYDLFEIVVVADKAGLDALDRFDGQIKCIPFEKANVSAARNLGVSHSAGEVIAFIDDDAVPEPTWLTYLIEPFFGQNVSAAGGFVRGRNGISFQWKARVLDGAGYTTDIAVDETRPTIIVPIEGQAVKTEGTNMAIRRDVLVKLGGFDTAYHFYLDETDLNMRLAAGGHNTAVVPLAQVHHGFAPSNRRRIDRVPRDLFNIGASWAVFHRKFRPEELCADHWGMIVESERKRLIGYLISGALEPQMVRWLTKRLHEGYASGKSRVIGDGRINHLEDSQLLRFPTKGRSSVFLSGRPINAIRRHADARTQVARNQIVTLYIFSPTALFHRAWFHLDGYWVQSGGLFGKSDREQKIFSFWSRKGRKQMEIDRVKAVRS